MKPTLNFVGKLIFTFFGAIVLLLSLHFAPKFRVSALENAETTGISCSTSLIAPPDNRLMISANSVLTMPNGEVVYLISTGRDRTEFMLIHVQADNTIRNLGTLPITEGYFSFPIWHYVPEQNSIYYLSRSLEEGTAIFGISVVNLSTGQNETLMQGVSQFDFEQFEHYIWWGAETSPTTILYNTQSNERTILDFSQFSEGLMPPIPLRWLSANELLLVDFARFYRANLSTSAIQPLHEDILGNSFDTQVLLENSILYISEEGILKEIDFAGNLLQSYSLQGTGFYSQLFSLEDGYVYSFYDGTNNNLYYLAPSGEQSRLNPAIDGVDSSPVQLTVVTDTQGRETIWFSIIDRSNIEFGILFAYQIANTGIVEVFRQENLTAIELSPNRETLIAQSGEEALLFSTSTFEQIATLGDYYGDRLFSSDNTKVYYRAGQTIEVYDFATNRSRNLFASQHESPRPLFVDESQNLLYIVERQTSSADPLGTWNIYAINLENSSILRLNSPEIPIPVETHERGFYATSANELLFFNESYTALYRVRCEA